MSIKRKFRSHLVNLLFNARLRTTRRWLADTRRHLSRQAHVISVFLELDDPYSYLLGQYLPSLAEHYDIELRLYLTKALGDAYRPRADMLAQYAERDCELLARELGVPFLDKGQAPPVEHRRALIDVLASHAGHADFDAELLQTIEFYWRGDAEGLGRRVKSADPSRDGDAMLAANQRRLVQLGHYNAATIHYAGEWYWGVDRLHYLLDRLDALDIKREPSTHPRLASIRQVMRVSLPVTPPSAARELPPLELFYSFGSPYAHLSLQRVYAIADAFGLQLRIRPVLPMVMRGMQIPKSKLIYMAADTVREAERMNIPFGKFADPVGAGAERCLAVFYYAQSEKRERDFVSNAGEAIWARGIDVATDKGMRKVSGRTGLFWPDVKASMEDSAWRPIVEENRDSMMESGLWGVPTMRIGDFVVWGQDRDWLLVRHIEELCDAGDGILI